MRSPDDVRGFGPGPLLTGYLAPDGTHHPCEAWAHRECARAICRSLGLKRPPIVEDDWRAPWVEDTGDDVLDPEQEMDARRYVRIHSSDRDDPMCVSFGAKFSDETATLTDAQVSWLRVHGYGRRLRELTRATFSPSAGAPSSPDAAAAHVGGIRREPTGDQNR